GANGGGSVDVVAAVGSAPIAVTRINDLQVPSVDPENALRQGTRGTLVAPAAAPNTRFNIGIRTLASGAAMTIRVYDTSGAEVRSTTRSFPPNYFQQFAAAELLGVAPTANQAVVVTIDGGSAIVYGVTDATLQVARPTSE